ncbi:hypothetical protein NTG1052_90015 [Candidatus Nitrotoga sp. 1052]|nr:hypothetical protein NTG1052_90015 [Candidatus Nitrotoga sp. 1052]
MSAYALPPLGHRWRRAEKVADSGTHDEGALIDSDTKLPIDFDPTVISVAQHPHAHALAVTARWDSAITFASVFMRGSCVIRKPRSYSWAP